MQKIDNEKYSPWGLFVNILFSPFIMGISLMLCLGLSSFVIPIPVQYSLHIFMMYLLFTMLSAIYAYPFFIIAWVIRFLFFRRPKVSLKIKTMVFFSIVLFMDFLATFLLVHPSDKLSPFHGVNYISLPTFLGIGGGGVSIFLVVVPLFEKVLGYGAKFISPHGTKEKLRVIGEELLFSNIAFCASYALLVSFNNSSSVPALLFQIIGGWIGIVLMIVPFAALLLLFPVYRFSLPFKQREDIGFQTFGEPLERQAPPLINEFSDTGESSSTFSCGQEQDKAVGQHQSGHAIIPPWEQ